MVCFVGVFAAYPQALKYIGVIHYGVWFMDLYAILASNDALAMGVDPYGPNPFDYLRRAHVYPHWWLLLKNLGFTRLDVSWLGCLIGAGFLAVTAARFRPKTPGELVWYIAALCSPPVILALERANNDLVIFLLLSPVPLCLSAKREMVRILAVPLIAAAAALKTYPIVGMLVLLAGTDRGELLRRWALVTLFCVVIGIDLLRDWPQFGRKVPDLRGLLSFGAAHGLILLGAGVAKAKIAAILIGAVAFVILLKTDLLARWSIGPDNRGAWWSFVLGATLLTGCFFAGTSFAYRWIFGLWLAPFIWYMLTDRVIPQRVRRLGIAVAVLFMAMLWLNGIAIALLIQFDLAFRHSTTDGSDMIVAIGQPLLWAFFLCLLVFLAHFVRESLSPYWKRGSAVQADS